jgi:hypothetical protein
MRQAWGLILSISDEYPLFHQITASHIQSDSVPDLAIGEMDSLKKNAIHTTVTETERRRDPSKYRPARASDFEKVSLSFSFK